MKTQLQAWIQRISPWIRRVQLKTTELFSHILPFLKTQLSNFKQEMDEDSSLEPVKHPLLKRIILSLMAFSLTIGLIAGTYLIQVSSNAPTLIPNDFIEQDSSKIYDAQGELIADIGQQIRENVRYEDLPQMTIDAFVAIEDSRFFEHNGFDLPRFVKAMLENVKTLSFSQGGSTFTMQLVKGTYFETEETLAPRNGIEGINRKIQEISLALEAERIIDKPRILEMYLNRINFGVPGNKRGIQTAAQYYFGKEVTQLNLVESALLAGVINAPNAYNPLRNPDLAKQRTDIVLDLMVYHGYITEEEAVLAKSVPIENIVMGAEILENPNLLPNQAYVDAVVDEVIALTGQDPVSVSMKIYTSMDRTLQTKIESVLNGEDAGVKWPNEVIQSGIVMMNNQTGEILGIGGGRNYEGERLFNRATDMYRQPGSSAKLILTYPLAFEYLGWSTQHILEDRPIIYAGTDVVIKNFDNVYRGDVTVAQAIGSSLNIPAIETISAVVNAIGVDKTIAYLNSIGFTSVTKENFDLGYGIGGSNFTASPLQMAGAYSAMINEGNYLQPHTVLKIEFADGSETLLPTYTETKALSTEAAYITSAMMEQDVSGPYRNFMQVLRRNFPVYAKTGTSDWGDTGVEFGIPKGAAKDKWMIVSTNTITTAVWVGYDKAVADQISYLDQTQINLNLPGKINNTLLNTLVTVIPKPTAIARPEAVLDMTHVKGVYPYASVTETTPAELIVSGLVKAEFSELRTLGGPVAIPANFSLANAAQLSGQVKGYDPFGSYVYLTVQTYPTHGTLEFDGSTGNFLYTHNGDKINDSFSFSANGSEAVWANLTLLPDPTDPLAQVEN